MKKLLLIFLLLNFELQAQTDTIKIPKFISDHPYLNQLYIPADDAQARLLTCSWQYLYSYQFESFRTGGMQLSVGVNVARFFSNKFVIGIIADVKGVKGLTQQHFSDDFINDFNESFITEYNKPSDSAKAYVISQAINDVPGHGFFGNYSGNLGIMFSLFPQKYGGVLISAKRGYRDFPIFGTYGNDFIDDGKLDNTLFQLKKNYSAEISIKPYTFFKNGYADVNNFHSTDIWKLITVGFYYEQLELENANFNGIPFSKIVKSKFLSRYDVDHCYGVKLGLSLY
ncbi:MAG: hypothetical protein KBF42_08520 [Chitinophagales bacterium]|jgi:hypothetical protein|nr:hypothetical protein [Bacteroidota bacterium]MBK7568261.1 hypothetical protein [Bacteroidota bacterium]MBP8916069.1 hypothetical protein [Chitinophagales bacterium]MBP9221414.1 hypothetical protein [Chitinophagales bacterium]MBP9795308.1 hypothetical protein [Chitinophagales bacterium]